MSVGGVWREDRAAKDHHSSRCLLTPKLPPAGEGDLSIGCWSRAHSCLSQSLGLTIQLGRRPFPSSTVGAFPLGAPASGWRNNPWSPQCPFLPVQSLPSLCSGPISHIPVPCGKPSLTQAVLCYRVKKPETYLMPKDGKSSTAAAGEGPGQPGQVPLRGT